MTTTRVALVGCGKLKQARPAPAGELYVGPLFRDARDHVLAAGYDHWLILSAEYGLVHPGRVLEPYDTTVDGLSVDERRRWAGGVEFRLRLGAGYVGSDGYVPTDYPGWAHIDGRTVFDAFASAGYMDPIREALHPSDRFEIREPLRGLQLGDRRGWFRAQRLERAA